MATLPIAYGPRLRNFIKGTDIASASTLTLPTDGNVFDVTGTTTINHLSTIGIPKGFTFILKFTAALTLTNNAGAPPANTAPVLLASGANFTTGANKGITLFWDGTNFIEAVQGSGGGGGGAPTGASYVVMGLDGTLTAERVATTSTSVSVVDGGAGGSVEFRRAALTGDVTASANANATTVANDAVTYAKMQNVSAASRLVGRGSAGGAGDPEEITLGSGLSMSGTALAATAFPKFHFYSDQFDNPNSANWIVNSLAPAAADSLNAALTVRRLDDTTEEGVGFMCRTPASPAANIIVGLVGRAQTAPGAARTVGVKLYFRQIPDAAAVSTTWAGANDGSHVLADIDIPATTDFQHDTQTLAFTVTTPDLVADKLYQMEVTRIDPTAGTELVGDWILLELTAAFS